MKWNLMIEGFWEIDNNIIIKQNTIKISKYQFLFYKYSLMEIIFETVWHCNKTRSNIEQGKGL